MSANLFRFLAAGLMLGLVSIGPVSLSADTPRPLKREGKTHRSAGILAIPLSTSESFDLVDGTLENWITPIDLKRGNETEYERADLVNDGIVNAKDLLDWIRLRGEETEFGNETPFDSGDLNGDQTLNYLDLILFQCEWMRTQP